MPTERFARALRGLHEVRGPEVSVVAVGTRGADAESVARYVCDERWSALFIEPAPQLVWRLLRAPGANRVTLDHASKDWHRGSRRPLRAVNLAAKLERHGVDRIDVLQLDAGAHGWPLLQQLNLARHRPAVILLRLPWAARSQRTAAAAHLRGAGYDVEVARGEIVAVGGAPTPTPAHRASATPVAFVTAVYDLTAGDALGGHAAGIGPYLLSLCSLAKMGAPFIVYTWPRHVQLLRRFADDEGLTWDVVGADLASAPYSARIQELRARREAAAGRQRDRCDVLNLAKGTWLAAAARRNPFGSAHLYWIDAGLSTGDRFPERFLGPDGFDCALFTPRVRQAIAAHRGLFAFATPTRVSGVLFGGPCAELEGFGRDYDEAVRAMLDDGRLGTVEDVLTTLRDAQPGRFTIAPLTTTTDAAATDDGDAFFRFFERATASDPAAARAPALIGRAAADVTVVLNTYKRPQTLHRQYAAVAAQSCPPAEVFVWQNYPDRASPGAVDPSAFDQEVLEQCVTVRSLNTNFGVWGRFAFALNARTKYVCVLDDDTIPGARWIENCLATIGTHRGLLGTVGIVQVGATYYEMRRVGWCNPNENVEQVDYVGHAWFFEREWLTTFWRELPDTGLFAFESEPHALCAGEDMHFSYTLQKYLGLGSFVPPHPTADRSLWGSDPDLAMTFGTDSVAISNLREPNWKFADAWASYRQRGFRFLRDG